MLCAGLGGCSVFCHKSRFQAQEAMTLFDAVQDVQAARMATHKAMRQLLDNFRQEIYLKVFELSRLTVRGRAHDDLAGGPISFSYNDHPIEWYIARNGTKAIDDHKGPANTVEVEVRGDHIVVRVSDCFRGEEYESTSFDIPANNIEYEVLVTDMRKQVEQRLAARERKMVEKRTADEESEKRLLRELQQKYPEVRP
jgi:hypothetical protein